MPAYPLSRVAVQTRVGPIPDHLSVFPDILVLLLLVLVVGTVFYCVANGDGPKNQF
jgi:hypothetical protein